MLFWSRVRESITDLRGKSHGAIGIQLPIGNCPPDSCIQMGSIPTGVKQINTTHKGGVVDLEQGTGIEPASVAWEATILPMN